MRHILLLLLLLSCLLAAPVAAQSPGPQRVTADTANAATGGTLTNGRYTLHGTLGQTSVATSRNTQSTVTGGIWFGINAAEVLVLEKTYRDVTPARTEVGETLTFIVAVTNNGVRPQTNIVVSDTLPVGLTLLPQSVTADKGTVTVGDNALTLHLATLSYEEIAVLTYRATVDAGAEGQALTNTAVAHSDSYGPVSESATVHVYRPTRIFLPLVMRGYPPAPPVVQVGDAPGTCPGLSIALDTFYREDFDGENDNDCFAFQAVAGQTYVLETGNLGLQGDTLLALFAATDCGMPLAENDDINYPHDVASRIVWTAPANGVYSVLVRSYDWRIYGLDTGYTLRVTRSNGVAPQSVPPSTEKPAPLPTPTALPDTNARASRRAPGLAAYVAEKPTPPPTPVKPLVVPTPTSLATPEAIPVQMQIVLLPETGRAGHLSAAGLVLTVLGAGAIWRKRRSAA
jgi:uncharacterized repeat protein (TIGR01451 family)